MNRQFLWIAILAATTFVLGPAPSPALADDFTWTPTGFDSTWDSADGNWSINGVSTPLIPDADDSIFIDTDLISTGSRFLLLNGDRQVQALTLSGTERSPGLEGFLIVGNPGDTLSLGAGNLNASLDTINVVVSDRFDQHEISTDVLLRASGVWDISDRPFGGQTLHVRGEIRDRPGAFDLDRFSLTKTGEGTLQVNDVDIHGDLLVEAGVLNLLTTNQISNNNGLIGDAPGTTGQVNISRSGATWTNSGGLIVGDEGTGSLLVEDGGSVSSGNGYIAQSAGSNGNVTVAGTDSNWTNSNELVVGEAGTGSLLIEDGGAVSNGLGVIANFQDSVGEATVTGAGSSWTNSRDLSVGFGLRSDGTLLVEDGGSVSNDDGSIAGSSDSTGGVTVTGAGSSWTNTGNLDVGRLGVGTLLVADGATVSSDFTNIGQSGAANGTATVTGAGSIWTVNSFFFQVGNQGDGTLSIEDGGAVSSEGGFIGVQDNATGSVTVTGAGSNWTNSGDLFLANEAQGTLLIEDGGFVSNVDVTIGDEAGSVGVATVTGNGSAWTSSGSVYVGGNASSAGGTGTVTISDNASMAVGDTLTVWDGGTVDFAGGALTADTIEHTHGGEFNFTGGTLAVNTFEGNLNNQGGTVSPGASPGTTSVTGDYSQDAASTLLIEIDGLTGGSEFDRVLVTGTASLDGTLDIELLTYTPQLGDHFDIIQAASFIGDFATFDLPMLSGGLFFQSEIVAGPLGTDSYRFTVVPEPATAGLALLGLTMLLIDCRRRRRLPLSAANDDSTSGIHASS